MNDVAMSFNDVLALTLVGLLWTWSPGRHAGLPVRMPEVTKRGAAVSTAAPMPVMVAADGALWLAGTRADVDAVIAAVEASPRALRVCADRDVTWGVVAARLADLQARWAWVEAGVNVSTPARARASAAVEGRR